ncbi:hypothetical protein ACFO1B_03280 [Dactylosporangium siamense]|uniref:Uncharacterized protein n=1 Tax=Dactylosporangium siamense TaxID=685454 RepID=A0A919PJG3_9ACTN|nr:hypothetical protein [Dactylosporangium siamense]GIG43098.1 hypothetical protein Dsi01nite_011390 [Dactylosporangium siamense]
MTAPAPLLEDFLALSVDLTAFAETDLRGTGLSEQYLEKVRAACGDAVVADLLAAHRAARADPEGFDRALRHQVLSDDRLGPVARAVIKLWFAGMWYGLPPEWTDRFGAQAAAEASAVTAASYQEGLLWRAIGANPPGAKAPGYGSWAEPPRIDERYLKGASK